MLLAVSTGFGFGTVSRCIGAGLVLTGGSGIGIALGSGTFSTGSGFDSPFDSVATTFSFGASVEGSGMAALLTSVALMALSPERSPPQPAPERPLINPIVMILMASMA